LTAVPGDDVLRQAAIRDVRSASRITEMSMEILGDIDNDEHRPSRALRLVPLAGGSDD
jgi:hypothetical protein